MSVTFPSIAILGAGSMGGALLSGLLASNSDVAGIAVTNRSEMKAAALRSSFVRSTSIELDEQANQKAVKGSQLVVVAVKPTMVADLLREIQCALEPDAVIVSVAAGVSIAQMESSVSQAVVRSAPNTASVVRSGVTGIAAGSRASETQIQLVRRFFETVGAVLVVPEDKINALSSISASGPAYVFFLMEQLTETAMSLGFDRRSAQLIVQQTFLGSSELLYSSAEGPSYLRRRVDTPNGSTERAVAMLESANLKDLFARATAAAIARAEELTREV